MGNIKYGNTTALKEYMINGGRVSRIESLLLFGVQNFTAVLTLIKRDGFSLDEIKKRISNQFDDKDKIPLSDYIINNKFWKDTVLELEKTYLKIKNLD